jgi:hypothetical protein
MMTSSLGSPPEERLEIGTSTSEVSEELPSRVTFQNLKSPTAVCHRYSCMFLNKKGGRGVYIQLVKKISEIVLAQISDKN